MDEDLALRTAFDGAGSFAEVTQKMQASRNNPVQVLHEEAGTQCETVHYNNIINEFGNRIMVRDGKKYYVGRDPNNTDFRFAIVQVKFWNKSDELEETMHEFQSPHMKAVIKAIIPEYKDHNIKSDNITTNEPYFLFHHRDELLRYGLALTDHTAREHVTYLNTYAWQLFEDAFLTHFNFVETAVGCPTIDFASLWTIFTPGDLVCVKVPSSSQIDYKTLRVFRFKSMSLSHPIYSKKSVRSKNFWAINCFRSTGSFITSVYAFPGLVSVYGMDICPLQGHPEEEAIKESLLARGKILMGFHQTSCHRQYSCRGDDGSAVIHRVVVDPVPEKNCCGNDSDDDDDGDKAGDGSASNDCSRSNRATKATLTDEEYIMCSPYVSAYDLNSRTWSPVLVSALEPVQYESEVFTQSLLLDNKYKNMISSLIRGKIGESGDGSGGTMNGKGNGLVFLLHGEPGTGNTLTAESIAEHCRRPLLRIDSSTLGTTSESVEKGLQEVLSRAARWKAIALLDEADVFMEQRSSVTSDITRNSLVAVFLRVLEYHDGILFLTTNRVGVFDAAFKSRVQVAIHYPPLGKDGRMKLWCQFLAKTSFRSNLPDTCESSDPSLFTVNKSGSTDDGLERLVVEPLNGRQIQNIVKVAAAVASGAKTPLTIEGLWNTLQNVMAFDRDFSQDSKRRALDADPEGEGGVRREAKPLTATGVTATKWPLMLVPWRDLQRLPSTGAAAERSLIPASASLARSTGLVWAPDFCLPTVPSILQTTLSAEEAPWLGQLELQTAETRMVAAVGPATGRLGGKRNVAPHQPRSTRSDVVNGDVTGRSSSPIPDQRCTAGPFGGPGLGRPARKEDKQRVGQWWPLNRVKIRYRSKAFSWPYRP
ncbi:hypothetical protein GGTG_12242 [Gaeumannomyces tritici R3-111a-1]|uniref:AAA+ ATPase domain-containing protein n=1 Tax=Gaeumannomyces tritici (strain R3-111a-1) TaxID=644352 RepID=J3PFG7_GAET3|nr:hypothetical protein GGTG_12242 [Gaeumannomyces tritici R3-111a-1]EJT70069.1 hypothetical protein GGTG_12242 [Gaeumannomyces tritici R3-111a-1]